MTVRPSPRASRSAPSLLSLAAGVAGLAVVVWLTLQSPPAAVDALPLAAWLALYASARILSVNLFGGEFTFSHILLLAAYLSFDLTTALWIGCAGVVVDHLARSVFHTRLGFEARSVPATLEAVGAGLARAVFSLSLAALAYTSAGGRAPLSDAPFPGAWPLFVLFLVYGVAASLVHFVLIYERTRAPVVDWARHNARHLILVLPLLLVLPLSLIIAVHYLTTEFGLFIAFEALMIVFMALLFGLSRAQTTLDKRLRERASVSAIGQAIVNSLDLPEVLEAIHRHISPLMDARNFYVALYNEDYDELSFPLVYEENRPTRYRSRTSGNGLVEHVLRTRAPLLIPTDVTGAIRRLGLEAMPGREARSWLGVPITIGDRALGVINVHSHDHANAYDVNHLEVLSTIASHTAVAIENAQLYASTRRRAAELAILNSVSTVVGSSLDLDQVMEAIVTSVGPVVGCQKAAILLVQEGGRSLAPKAARGLSRAFLDQMPAMMRMVRGEGAVSSAERQPLIVGDVRSDPRFAPVRAAVEAEGIRACADMPLQARDHIIGTLAVCYTEPHRFTVAELDLLTTFANQAAVAVSNAALYARTDQALSRRVEELAALEEISRELTGTLDLNRVMERVLDAAIEAAGATRGLVALYDADQRTLQLVAARGYPADRLEEAAVQRWLAGHTVMQSAIHDSATVWIEDVLDYPSYQSLDPAVRSVLVIPILRDGQPLGVINLASERRASFNKEVASFVGQLATQAAVAIRNAQLHQQTQNRLSEMSILFDLSRQATAILDLSELGKELASQLAQALGTTHCLLELIAHASDRLEPLAVYVAPGGEPIALPQEPAGALRRLDIDQLRPRQQPAVIYASDAIDHPADYEFLRSHKLYALIGLPLVAGNDIIGRVIWLHSQPRAPFSADEIRFAHTLANQASVAVQNARLFRERERRVTDLAQLYQASLALATSIELEEALGRIALIAREITGSEAVTVYLYDERADRVTLGVHLAGAGRPIEAWPVRPQGMTRRVITTRQPVLINDTLQEPDVNPRVLEAGLRSVIAMPIVRTGQVLGVLYVNSRTPGAYTADSLQLVQLLANEAAVAIENAQLFGQIADARDRLAAILNSSRDGVLMFDVSGRVIIANPMLERMWGIRRAELEGRSLLRLLDTAECDLPERLGYALDELRSLLAQATSGVPTDWGKDIFTLASDTRPRSIERSGLPVLDESGGLIGWMLILRDVTEEYELQLMREDLTNMIVHDLRSPLVAILDSYELIGEAMPPLLRPALAGSALDVGQRSTRKLLDLVNSLLDISRFEHGAAPVDTQFAALRPLAENALEQLAPMIVDRGVILRNEISDELPLVKVDEDQIKRVWINLIDNAVKFSPPGGEVTLLARPPGNGDRLPDAIVCSVRDMGPGVPPEHREHIFERFVQLSAGLERRRGTGLGLAFCKMAIEAHGGSIWVEDAPDGRGSQFSFTLPVAALHLPP
jgi:PAS domain S-box-containing protein